MTRKFCKILKTVEVTNKTTLGAYKYNIQFLSITQKRESILRYLLQWRLNQMIMADFMSLKQQRLLLPVNIRDCQRREPNAHDGQFVDGRVL